MAVSSSKRYLVTVVILMAVILGSSLGFTLVNFLNKPDPVIVNASVSGKVDSTIVLKVYDSEGNLKQTMKKYDDLALQNTINYMASIFYGVPGTSGYQTMTATDDGNTARTFYTAYDNLPNSICDSYTGSARKGGFIGVGTGTNAPTRSDYALQTKQGAYTAVTASYPTYDSTSGNLTIPAQVAVTGSWAVTEACLGTYWIDSGGTLRNILHYRDTFTAVNVVSSDVIAVTYILHFHDTEFLTNLINIYGGTFENVADNAHSSVWTSVKKVSDGTALTMRNYYGATTSVQAFSYRLNYLWYSACMIGTGNTAVTRADYKCQTAVETATPFTVTTGSTNIILTADVPCVSARTVTEAGFITESSSVAGYTIPPTTAYTTMLIRVVFGGVSVPAGGSIRVVLTITF